MAETRWRHTRRINVKDRGPHEPRPDARVSDGTNRCETCGDYIVKLKPVVVLERVPETTDDLIQEGHDSAKETVAAAVAEVLSAYVEASFTADGVPDVGPTLIALAEEFDLDLASMSLEAAGFVAVGRLGSKEVYLKETPDCEDCPSPVYLGDARVGYVEFDEGGDDDNRVRFVARVGDFETGVRFAEFEATVEPDTSNDAANRAAMAVAQEAGK